MATSISCRLIRLPEVKKMTGLSKSAIYQRIADGRFPTQVRLGVRAVAWSEAAVEQWITNQIKSAS